MAIGRNGVRRTRRPPTQNAGATRQAIGSERETARCRVPRHDDRRLGSFDRIRFTAGTEGGPGRSGQKRRKPKSCPAVWSRNGRCRAGDMGRQTEGRFRSKLLQPRGAGSPHPRRRKVLLAQPDANLREIPREREEGRAEFESPEAGATNSRTTSPRLGQRELRWALVSSRSGRTMRGRLPECDGPRSP